MRVYVIHSGDDIYRYVGVCKQAPNLNKSNKRFMQWLAEQKIVVVEFIEEGKTAGQASDSEKTWIKVLSKEGHPLLNEQGLRRTYVPYRGKD